MRPSTPPVHLLSHEELAALQLAAEQELAARVAAAHTQILQLLARHGGDMSPRQIASISKRLRRR